MPSSPFKSSTYMNAPFLSPLCKRRISDRLFFFLFECVCVCVSLVSEAEGKSDEMLLTRIFLERGLQVLLGSS